MTRWIFFFVPLTLFAHTTRFHNARVFHSYRDNSFHKELWVENGKVIPPKASADTSIDLNGAFVFPALTDAHAHLIDTGREDFEINLKGLKSSAEAVAAVRAFLEKQPTLSLLTGAGWDQSDWPGKQFPHRELLDQVSNSIPIVLYRVDGHAAWVNTFALKRSGLWDDKTDPTGGKIIRDKSDVPTGILIDRAMDALELVQSEINEHDFERFTLAAVTKSLSLGITGIHDAGFDQKNVPRLRKLIQDRDIPFRFYQMLSDKKGRPTKPVLGELDNRLNVRAVKLFADGAMGSRGAAFNRPYNDDPGNSGLLFLSQREMEKRMREWDRKGFQIAIHAIGDKANWMAVEAMEKALGPKIREKRPRLEHAQVLDLPTIDRIAKLGIIASMQPTHCTSDMKWVVDRIGKERARYSYAWKTLLSRSVPLAFGSDSPVESINPWPGVFSAMTRSNGVSEFFPEEAISMREALIAFSEGAAYAGFQEGDAGTLTAGKHADFLVTRQNPLDIKAGALSGFKVAATYVGGKEAWKSTQ